MMLINSDDNLVTLGYKLFKLKKFKVTKTKFEETIKTDPNFPTLLSLSNTCKKFNIENHAFQIENEDIEKITPPFIGYINNQTNGKDFVLVTNTNQNRITYIANDNKTKTLKKEEFLNIFEKVVFVAEGNFQSGEENYLQNLKKEAKKQKIIFALRFGTGFLVAILLALYFFAIPISTISGACFILFLKISGLITSILLLTYEIDKTSNFVKNLCSAFKQTNCLAVINSKASKLFGMSWSEVGFFYYSSSLLFLILSTYFKVYGWGYIAIANAFAAPYIVFSIYYQWRIVKQWCPLCLIIQFLLLSELIWSIIFFWANPSLTTNIITFTIFLLTLCIFIPPIAWYSLKPILLKSKNEPTYKNAYKRLLYNPVVFNAILQQQPSAPDAEFLGIDIGNPNASISIIKVCNPYCTPCANSHSILEKLIQNNNNIKLKIIFTATNHPNDPSSSVVKHLMAIKSDGDYSRTREALDDWYLTKKKDFAFFAEKYPFIINDESRRIIEIEEMNKWCYEANITFTPTIFLNGYRIPEEYSIEDLSHILNN